MLIKLRDKQGRLCAKDVFDIDFDMYVTQARDTGKYMVVINPQYFLDGAYDNKEAAEAEAYRLIDDRNDLEEELRQ